MSIVKNVNPDMKITYYLDKVLFLYKSLDKGIKVNKCEFDILYDKIIILCNININKSLFY